MNPFLLIAARFHFRMMIFVVGVLALPVAYAGKTYCVNGAYYGNARKCTFTTREGAAAWSFTTNVVSTNPEYSLAAPYFDEGLTFRRSGTPYGANFQRRFFGGMRPD